VPISKKTAKEFSNEKKYSLLLDEEEESKNSQLIKTLRQNGKSNQEFENRLTCLTFEELVALKLELSLRSIKKGLYGLPLWTAITALTKDAILTAVLSRVKTKTEAARILGIRYSDFSYFVAKYLYREIFFMKENLKVRRNYFKGEI
jgi:hypothetical protein